MDLLDRAIKGELDWETKRKEKQQPLMLNENEAMMTFETARAFIKGKAGPNYPAPLTILGVMQASANLPLEAALEIEAEGFAELAKSPEATSLIGLFLGDQLLKKKAKSSKKIAEPVKSLCGYWCWNYGWRGCLSIRLQRDSNSHEGYFPSSIRIRHEGSR